VKEPLLVRAAECYQRAGWIADACRCFEGAQRWQQSAQLHEEREQWGPAARAYFRAEEWAAAARCHHRDGQPASAADCLLRDGDVLPAAWLLADTLHRFARARAVLTEVRFRTPAATLSRELVLARCEAGTGAASAAARRLHETLARLGEVRPGSGRRRIEQWADAVAHALHRPDLVALVHAAATRAEIPGAAARWESWATTSLGDASGLPLPRPEDDTTAEEEPDR
jgi:hypothetical protein